MAETVRLLYQPKITKNVPDRFQKIVGQFIDYRKPSEKTGSYMIMDTPHNREVFKSCGVTPHNLIANFCGSQNVHVFTYDCNQEALALLRKD